MTGDDVALAGLSTAHGVALSISNLDPHLVRHLVSVDVGRGGGVRSDQVSDDEVSGRCVFDDHIAPVFPERTFLSVAVSSPPTVLLGESTIRTPYQFPTAAVPAESVPT